MSAVFPGYRLYKALGLYIFVMCFRRVYELGGGGGGGGGGGLITGIEKRLETSHIDVNQNTFCISVFN